MGGFWVHLSGRIASTIRGTSGRWRQSGAARVWRHAPWAPWRRSHTRLRAVPWRDALLLRILGRRYLHQGPHQHLIGRDPVGDRVPLLPVPLLELHPAAPLMITAGEGER